MSKVFLFYSDRARYEYDTLRYVYRIDHEYCPFVLVLNGFQVSDIARPVDHNVESR